MFDLVDADGYSFGDTTIYPGTTFAGTRFFGYAHGSGNNDVVLGFPLKYQNFNNIGDIVFDNYYDTQTFNYTGSTVECSSGYLYKDVGLATEAKVNNWVSGVEPTLQYQLLTTFYEGRVITDATSTEFAYVQIDTLPNKSATVSYFKVYLNNTLLTNGVDYDVTKYGVYNIILFTNDENKNIKLSVGDKIDVAIYSDTPSTNTESYYEIPNNLEYNPLNETFKTITLGQLRTHYNTLIENTAQSVASSRPIQDSYLKKQGGTLLQQSSPLVYAMAFLNDPDANFIDSINLARKEYGKFKNKFLNLCETLTTIDYNDPVIGVDTILQNINAIKNSSFSWYYSDMVPQGKNYNSVVYTVLNARQTNYEISSIFDYTQLSNRAVLVYVNGEQKVLGPDYTFSLVSPAIIFSTTLTIGDTIEIRDYFDTDGNYIPETPTKLGLYPKFEPEIYTDITYQIPVQVIRGHDGSITPAFGDFRDQYILELEKRIYNNIKADYKQNMMELYDIIPGRFRTTDYSAIEWARLLSHSFLQWTGANNLDYLTNTWYEPDNHWTWNYSLGFKDVVDGSNLRGSWRAIYEYWFDTDTPNLTPWEMLGFGSKPSWWEDRYGPAPYTQGNAVLWDDLEAGYIWNNGNPYTDTRFARPGLSNFIPVNNEGNLLSPTEIPLTKQYTTTNAGKPYSPGERGPVEQAWVRSSDYPFAIQVALAVAKPAKYFSTQIDISRFYTNPVTGHLSTAANKKLAPGLVVVNGDTTLGTTKRASGYLNWIADNIKHFGIDPVTTLNGFFRNFNVQLTHKVGGFTDQKLITVTAEQTSPGTKNASVLIPNENYHLYLNKSVPQAIISYSGVIVERVQNGYSVTGYDNSDPFFNVLLSRSSNNKEVIRVNAVDITILKDTNNTVIQIPYGTVFTSINQVVDFLVSYQRFLERQGFKFDQWDQDLQKQRDFVLSAQEFAYWSQQGFDIGSVIVLSPVSQKIEVNSIQSIVGSITNLPGQGRLFDQNFKPIKPTAFNIVRQPGDAGEFNTTTISTVDGSVIAFAKLNLVQFEHVLIFDNVDNFNDIIYLPHLGNRQFRLGIKGRATGNWNGTMSTDGYVYNDPIIDSWKQGTDYNTGDLVKFNNAYYTATTNIPASEKFGNNLWKQINPTDIQTGLLPSLGTNAQVFEKIYDMDNPPDAHDLQMFSAGLIGFRERPFLTDLGLSISNQAKFYQGYVKEKGTINAINALTRAKFNNVNGELNTYEEWAFQVGAYGDIDNNKFAEFVLDQSVFTVNPVTVLLTDHYKDGNAIVNLAVTGNTLTSNVYNSNDLLSTSTKMYDNRLPNAKVMTDLPTAGFVNINDIDDTIFDLSTIDQSQDTNYSIGNKIWVAKDSNKKWNVFRVCETGILAKKLTYTLDDYVQVDFDNPHNFLVDDYLVLKNFNKKWDGLYKIVNIPNRVSVTIQLKDKTKLGYLISVSPFSGSGLVHKLSSVVLDSVKELPDVRPLYDWDDGEHVWIENSSPLGWGTFTVKRPWLANTVQSRTSATPGVRGNYGAATASSLDNNWLYVGAPGTSTVEILSNVNYVYSSANVINSADNNFGYSIATSKDFVVISSPDAGNVRVYTHGSTTPLQVITSANANGKFGSSVDISNDGHWLYVSEPATGVVHAYTTVANTAANLNYVKVSTKTVNSSIIKTNASGTRLFVGAPNDFNGYNQGGNVYVYTRTANTVSSAQTISGVFKNDNARFGTSLDIDKTGNNLFVGVPNSTISTYANGLVERWIYNGSQFVHQANIAHPGNTPGTFGSSISVTADAKLLAVGSAGSQGEESTTFDNDATQIDKHTTKFIDYIMNSGVVYMFDSLIDYKVANDPGTYIYGQELSAQLTSGDQFGTSIVATRDVVVVGAPGVTVDEYVSAGESHVYVNANKTPMWDRTREQQPVVDIDSINRTFVFDKTNNNILAALDYFDPNKGKILNSVASDVDYQRIGDPALYNAGSTSSVIDLHWGPDQVGKIWWDLDHIRFIDYEQDDLYYRLNHWGKRFPGSQVLVYEWVESDVPPSKYEGDGTPLYMDDSKYSTYGFVDPAGAIKLKYYFWVSEKTTINVDAGKSNSAYSIAASIENPQSQGVAYATVLRDDCLALYNVSQVLSGKNAVLHITSRSTNAGLIHSEYALVQEGNPASLIPGSIKDKFIDSLAGQDKIGNPVPDPTLTPAQAYGINIRPRQSMFVSHDLALSNYLELVNNIMATYQVARRKVLTLLNSEESAPNINTGLYSQIVNNDTELGYINTTSLATGYSILVVSDETQMGKWAIYTWDGDAWAISRVQDYKTNLYWNYADWYTSDYDVTRAPDLTVATALELGKYTLVAETYVKVTDAGNGDFEIYYIDADLNKTLVGIQNGTVQISTGSIPKMELRQLLIAMQEEIFVDDLALDYNKIFFALIKFALTEQKNPDWVFKTSFLTATQYLRKLEQFPSYIADNQDFYKEYINEVKPYRTVLREFVVDYLRNDSYSGDVTDFDLPPYWDSTLTVYRSPSGEQAYDTTLLTQGKYNAWSDNYKYKLIGIQVNHAGTGYTLPPQIVIIDEGGHGAEAYATLDGNGGVGEIIVTNPGEGFVIAPKIIINGSGTGAVASPILRNVYLDDMSGYNLVRSLSTTIKFDRTSYTNPNTFVFWDTLTSANVGQQIPDGTILRTDDILRKLVINNWVANTSANLGSLMYRGGNTYTVTGNVYQAVFNSNVLSNLALITANARSLTVDANITFPYASVTSLTAKDFDNANDRIVAFNGNIDLSNVTDGIDYMGVIVDGNEYIPYAENDSVIESRYTDSLGVDPSGIDIDGGGYVDVYSSHAPQELVPGRMYDSLNMSVYTAGDNQSLAYRIFNDMNHNINYYRISSDYTTTLSANLSLTDEYMYVDDATKLPTPDTVRGYPGVVFVNGEKITYWRNYAKETPTAWVANLRVGIGELISYQSNTYITTGNVFARYFANISSHTNNSSNIDISGNANVRLVTNINTITRLRRAVEGTGPSNVHLAGSRVVASNFEQAVPGTTITTKTIASETSYQTTDVASVVLAMDLTNPISANLGDNLQQQIVVDDWRNGEYSVGSFVYWDGDTYQTTANIFVRTVGWQSNTVYPTGSYVTQNGNTYVTTGNAWAQNKSWTANTVFATNSNIYIGSNSYYTTTGNVYVSIPTWTSNTVFATNTSIYHNGNVYRVTGNVYAPNVTWAPGLIVPTGSYINYQGSTYQTMGNVGYITRGNITYANGNIISYGTTSLASWNKLAWRVIPVDNTPDSGFFTASANLVNTGSILQFANINANVQFLYRGINAGFNSIKSNVQYLPTANIAWQPNTCYTVGDYISYNSNVYIIGGNICGNSFANISANLVYNGPLQTPDQSKFASIVNSHKVVQAFTGNAITSVTLKVMDTVSNVSRVPVIITVGSITALPEIFDGPSGFDIESFDNNPGSLYINGNAAYSFVEAAGVLGNVSLYGTSNVSPGTVVNTERVWYNRGLTSAVDGYGLYNSITAQATFLKDKPGFLPDPGVTP